jgi:pyruvate/2-oxoglutarate/acetoin dehydrogenase E1 component
VRSEAFWSMESPIEVVTAPPTPIPAGPELEDGYCVSTIDVQRAIERVMSEP